MPGLSLIHKGDPVALAALFNRSLQSRGVQVQVRRQSDWLHLLVEAGSVPVQQKTVNFVRLALRQLSIKSVQKVTVYGRRQGDRSPAWQQTIGLQATLPTVLCSTPPTHVKLMEESITPVPAALHNSQAEALTATPTDTPTALPPREAIDSPSAELPNIFQRPEAVAFIIFCSLVLFWEAYLAAIEATSNEASQSQLTSSQLAHRLKTTRSAVRSMRRQAYFSEWTRSLDPEQTAWIYHRGVYLPQ